MSDQAAFSIGHNDHKAYMLHALSLARLSPARPTNFRVGAVIVDATTNTILSTGYTLELPGNTHAEQCCIAKLCALHNCSEEELGDKLPEDTVLYTTVEPCAKRLSGNKTCVERILGLGRGLKKVYVGVGEPETFVGQNPGRKRLEDSDIEVVIVEGLEKEILEVATAGHIKNGDENKGHSMISPAI